MQLGRRWLLRAARVDERRFVVLAAERGADRRRMREAVNYFRTPLSGQLQQLDAVSPNRLKGFSELFSSVTRLALAGLAAS